MFRRFVVPFIVVFCRYTTWETQVELQGVQCLSNSPRIPRVCLDDYGETHMTARVSVSLSQPAISHTLWLQGCYRVHGARTPDTVPMSLVPCVQVCILLWFLSRIRSTSEDRAGRGENPETRL